MVFFSCGKPGFRRIQGNRGERGGGKKGSSDLNWIFYPLPSLSMCFSVSFPLIPHSLFPVYLRRKKGKHFSNRLFDLSGLEYSRWISFSIEVTQEYRDMTPVMSRRIRSYIQEEFFQLQETLKHTGIYTKKHTGFSRKTQHIYFPRI